LREAIVTRGASTNFNRKAAQLFSRAAFPQFNHQPIHSMPIKYINQLPPKSKIEVGRRIISSMNTFNVGELSRINLVVERLDPLPRKMSQIERVELAIEILQSSLIEMRSLVDVEASV
jgi:hypothetical protein